jgi:hypothetical protein
MRRGFLVILSGAKKMFSEPNINTSKEKYRRNISLNTSPLLEKGAKGKIKYFEKNHCRRLLLIPHTKYKTEQHNKDRGYFTPVVINRYF